MGRQLAKPFASRSASRFHALFLVCNARQCVQPGTKDVSMSSRSVVSDLSEESCDLSLQSTNECGFTAAARKKRRIDRPTPSLRHCGSVYSTLGSVRVLCGVEGCI